MGAGGKFPYPKEVWSPAGGWWPYPKNWRVNTAMAFVLLFGLSVPVFIASERKMVRYSFPTSRFKCVTDRVQNLHRIAGVRFLMHFPLRLRLQVHYEKPDRPIPWRRYLGSKQEDEAAAAAKAAE